MSLGKIVCSIFGHFYYLDKESTEDEPIIKCDWCNQKAIIHPITRKITKIGDSEMKS